MLTITGQKSKVWSVAYVNAVMGLSHKNLLKGLTKLCAQCKFFLEVKALEDPIGWAINGSKEHFTATLRA